MSMAIAEISHEQFLANRRTGIGGSDAAAILGLSPWSNPARVYMDKLNLGEPITETFQMTFGKLAEPIVAGLYLDQCADGLRLEESKMVRHPKYTFMIAHPDRLVFQNGNLLRGVELKTTSPRNRKNYGEAGSNKVPDYYNLQVQHYMAVTGLSCFDLAVLFGNEELSIFPIVRDERIISVLIEKEQEFWEEHVQKQVMPDIDGSKDSAKLLAAMFAKDSGEEILADMESADLVDEYFAIDDQIKELGGDLELRKNLIKKVMGDASRLSGPGFSVTWKKTKDGEKVDYKGLVKEIHVDPDVLTRFTSVKEGSRRFYPRKVEN